MSELGAGMEPHNYFDSLAKGTARTPQGSVGHEQTLKLISWVYHD